VDRTAGRLARWLRILGLDAEYAATCDEASITRRARQSGRIVASRNRNLVGRLKGQSILLISEHLGDQIRQVLDKVGWDRCEPFSRCSVCNVALLPVAREKVKGRVPEYVYRRQDRFAVCPVCGRYYWRGTHCDRMQEEIERITGGRRDGNQQDCTDAGDSSP
jgi:uncharacterized protein with PIN domain